MWLPGLEGVLGPLEGRLERRPEPEFPGAEDEVLGPCVGSRPVQVLSSLPGPELPLDTSAVAEGHLPLPLALALLSAWPRL